MDPSGSERYCYDPVLRWDPQVEEYFTKAYGPDHFARISKALTRPSSYSCVRVNTVKTTSDAVIEKLSKILNDSEEGLKLLQPDGTSPISKCQIPGLDYLVFVNGSGPHKIQYDFGLENPPKEVLVSRKCAEAVLRGAQVYVPGVLACTAHVEKGDAVAVCVAMEQPGDEGDWSVNMTRGTTLQGLPTGKNQIVPFAFVTVQKTTGVTYHMVGLDFRFTVTEYEEYGFDLFRVFYKGN